MKVEILTTVLLRIPFFWDVMLCHWDEFFSDISKDHNESTFVLQNVWNHSSNDTMLYPRRVKSSLYLMLFF